MYKKSTKLRFFWTVIGGAAAFSLWAKTPTEPLALEELQAFSEAYYQIKTSYVKEVDDVTLLRAAINGMVAHLDRHSRYLSPDDFARFNSDNEGEYAGIGLSFNDHKFGLEIAEVLKNSPAERAGLEVGMIVTEVGGESIKFKPAEEIYQLLKGQAGTSISLTVASTKFPQPKVIELTREIILIESVTSKLLDSGVGYIAINQFTLHSVEEFKRAVEYLSRSKPLNKLIIDLRDNPGGVMEVALELADLFIARGKLLISAGRAEGASETYYAHSETPFRSMEILVMINEGSASASEIMAAALKDHRRATIFGSDSYGKGSIQSIFALNDKAGMKLTTAEYYSPSGKKIQDVGVKPNVYYKPESANLASDSKSRASQSNISTLDASSYSDLELEQAHQLLINL
ncbi:S41 family peptidase [Aliikangiella sp. G2MR2-5]|uniref:S41 family peptidase n=1 Tax=Aliikangiella sp. G2MR2-5 TaxID=2788943 RepID=UPI0018A99618|nr:S41 family peptidase [Aliikangiella sp. G2MR2-5]